MELVYCKFVDRIDGDCILWFGPVECGVVVRSVMWGKSHRDRGHTLTDSVTETVSVSVALAINP